MTSKWKDLKTVVISRRRKYETCIRHSSTTHESSVIADHISSVNRMKLSVRLAVIKCCDTFGEQFTSVATCRTVRLADRPWPTVCQRANVPRPWGTVHRWRRRWRLLRRWRGWWWRRWAGQSPLQPCLSPMSVTSSTTAHEPMTSNCRRSPPWRHAFCVVWLHVQSSALHFRLLCVYGHSLRGGGDYGANF